MTSLNLAVHEPNVDPQPLPVIEWKGLRVVTTETLAAGYGTDTIRIQQNHIRNESRFVEGVHFFYSEGWRFKGAEEQTIFKRVSW